MKRVCLILIVLTGTLFACKHEVVAPVNPGPGTGGTGGGGTGGGGTGGGGGTDTALCFERDVLPIFVSNCAQGGCHDAASRQEGYVFTSYQTIVSKKFSPGSLSNTELWAKINENNAKDRMPPLPNAPLTAQQKSVIRDWILRGAPNTGNCSSGCDTLNVTFGSTILPMLTLNCRGCHSTAAPSSGISLDNYAGVQAVVQNGRLLGAIKHQTGFSAMPKSGNQLSNCQIRQVEIWIAGGAKNN